MTLNLDDYGKVSITVEEDYHSPDKIYDKLTVVEDYDTIATYISRTYVPAGVSLSDRHYWICLGRIDTNAVEYITNVKAILNELIRQASELHDGKSAYEIAVEHGYEGTEIEWLLSLKGEQGEQGIQGIQGEKGEKGDKGNLLFPSMEFEPLTGELVITGEDIEDNFDFDVTTGELIFNL